MSSFNQTFNKDLSQLRNIFLGVLGTLHDTLYYYNYVDGELVKVNVPFYTPTTGQERFLWHSFYEDEGKFDGNYDVVPRAIVEFNKFGIDSSSKTNKFIRTKFVRQVKQQLKTISATTNFIPVTLGANITVECSTHLEILKVIEAIATKLYKTLTFHFDCGLGTIQASISLSEDYEKTLPIEFSINDKKNFTVTFDIEVKTFFVVLEHGILISELDTMLQNSNLNNPGVGLLRSSNDGTDEILFGGILGELFANIETSNKIQDSSDTNI